MRRRRTRGVLVKVFIRVAKEGEEAALEAREGRQIAAGNRGGENALAARNRGGSQVYWCVPCAQSWPKLLLTQIFSSF